MAFSADPIAARSKRVTAAILCHLEQVPLSLPEELKREFVDAKPWHWQELQASDNTDFDVVILWVSTSAGLDFVREVTDWISQLGRRVAVIGCAPNGDIEDRIAALELGVDDFVSGRCGARELACRIHALHLRIRAVHRPSELSFRGLHLSPAALEAVRDGNSIRLSSTEMAVLTALMRGDGRTLTRSQILSEAWPNEEEKVGERAVDNVILRLRRKLGEPPLIETVRGFGFRMSENAPETPVAL